MVPSHIVMDAERCSAFSSNPKMTSTLTTLARMQVSGATTDPSSYSTRSPATSPNCASGRERASSKIDDFKRYNSSKSGQNKPTTRLTNDMMAYGATVRPNAAYAN